MTFDCACVFWTRIASGGGFECQISLQWLPLKSASYDLPACTRQVNSAPSSEKPFRRFFGLLNLHFMKIIFSVEHLSFT